MWGCCPLDGVEIGLGCDGNVREDVGEGGVWGLDLVWCVCVCVP